MKSLQKLQSDMARAVLGVKLRDKMKIKDMLQELEMLSQNQMSALEVLMQAWKAKNFNLSPLNDFCRGEYVCAGLRSEAQGIVKQRESYVKGFQKTVNFLWNQTSAWFRTTNVLKVAKIEALNFVKQLPI